MREHFRPVEVLLIEDNPADALLAEAAFQEGLTTNHVNVVRDGVEALDFLKHRGRHIRSPRPDIILLDLELPGKGGREILAEVKSDPILRCIPVMMLTSSTRIQDLQGAYELHVNCYIAKPQDYDQYIDMVRTIEHFWFHIVTLAPSSDPCPVISGGSSVTARSAKRSEPGA